MRRRIVRVAGLAAVSTVLASGAVLMSSGAASADTAGHRVGGLVIVGSTPASGGVVVNGSSGDLVHWTWPFHHRRHRFGNPVG